MYHSIRKTFITLLENAGVSENLAADIVGHEKPRITYGLYSGGTSVAVKAAAVEKVKYPGALGLYLHGNAATSAPITTRPAA